VGNFLSTKAFGIIGGFIEFEERLYILMPYSKSTQYEPKPSLKKMTELSGQRHKPSFVTQIFFDFFRYLIEAYIKGD